ncbi:MAG: AMP-binding protein [Bacteroidetes bacterium]|nr:AMP-binding protein [Bacteroidota bacterium]
MWINLNGRKLSIEEISSFSLAQAKTDFEKSTIEFCQAWLRGQQQFTIQTSGSTGAPKKITFLRKQMEASAQQTIRTLQLKPGHTSLVCLNTQYIAGQMMLVRSLLQNMNVIAVEPSSNPLDTINRSQQIDFAALVPLQLENVVSNSIKSLDKIKNVIIGGASLSNSLKEKIKDLACNIFATYGMTETISHIALQKLTGSSVQEYFQAFEGVSLHLDDRNCLCVSANYLQQEIQTNDIVELINDRKFRWLGRFDNIINSGGVKIIPEKIEHAFEKIAADNAITQRFYVTGIPDEKLGERVVIIFEGRPFAHSLQERVIKEVKEQLTKFEVPKEILFLEKFAETATGKIKRKN